MTPPRLTAHHALFLDIDGTLIDLAPTPDSVIVQPGLHESLNALKSQLGGALAILSGRKLADIDRLLPPGLTAAAEHGMILRGPDGQIASTAKRPAAYAHWLETLNTAAQSMPGVLVEQKQFSLVAHYRQAPQYAPQLRDLVENLIAQSPDSTLLLAHCAFELKPRSGNKADALAHFMALPPFTGRIPIFIGDDTTDEPAIAKASALGGTGLHVARDFGGKTASVREFLSLRA